MISIDSPLALVGKALDAEVQVQTPTGTKLWYVVDTHDQAVRYRTFSHDNRRSCRL